MKFSSFKIDGRDTYGVYTSRALREVDEAFRARFPDLRSAIAAGALGDVEAALTDVEYPVATTEFLPLIPRPDKILCVGVNYRPHIEEMGREVPDFPVVFVRFAASQTGHGQPVIRPRVSEQFDYEGELAIVIGRRARHVARANALHYIAGYCCFLDGSVRDWQRHTSQFTPGKNFPHSGSMGPCLVTRDEIPDPAALRLTTRLNGEVMQEGCVGELVFDIPRLIEYRSTFAELLPGDVIATGTPGGVGAARVPPVWLNPGDTINVEVGGIGKLVNPVLDEPAESSS